MTNNELKKSLVLYQIIENQKSRVLRLFYHNFTFRNNDIFLKYKENRHSFFHSTLSLLLSSLLSLVPCLASSVRIAPSSVSFNFFAVIFATVWPTRWQYWWSYTMKRIELSSSLSWTWPQLGPPVIRMSIYYRSLVSFSDLVIRFYFFYEILHFISITYVEFILNLSEFRFVLI